VGVDFSYVPTATNLPFSYSASNLPPGLFIDEASGFIYGHPTSAGTYAVSLVAANALGQGQATITIAIAAVPAAPMITNTAAVSATIGITGVVARIAATNSPTQYTASGLPPGLSLDTSSGAISGTPNTLGTYVVPVSAANAGGTAAATLTFAILPPALPTFNGPAAISGAVGVPISVGYDVSSSYYFPNNFSATGLPSGLTIDGDGGITGTPKEAGVFPVQISTPAAGGTFALTLNLIVAAAPPPPPSISGTVMREGEVGQSFSFTYGIGDFLSNYAVPVTIGAVGLPPGLVFDTESGEMSGIPTAAGIFPVTISASNTGGSISGQTTIIIYPARVPVITSALGSTGYVGQSFSYSISSDRTATYSVSELPPGLSLKTGTKTISGSPTSAGDYLITLSATNTGGTSSAQLRLKILPAPTTYPVITSPASAVATATTYLNYTYPGANFAYVIKGAGFPTSFTATGLPAGLSLNTRTGEITGRLMKAGTFLVPISATNAMGTATATLTIKLLHVSPAIATSANAVGHVGVFLSRTFDIASSLQSLSPKSYTASGLPPGVSVNTVTSEISGTPTVAGTFLTTVFSSSNAGAASAPITFIIDNVSVPPSGPAFSIAPAAQQGVLGTTLTYDFWVDGSPTALSATSLPPGLSFSTPSGTFNGVPTKYGHISGIPTATGVYTVPLQAQNALGSVSATATFFILATPASPPLISSSIQARATIGANFTYNISLSDKISPVIYAASNLPPGLSVDTSLGVISGVPQAAGTFAVPISATGAVSTASGVLTIICDTLSAATTSTPIVNATAGALGFVGVPLSLNASALLADDLSATSLPPGINLSIEGGSLNGRPAKFATLGGIPTTPGTFTIPFTAHNSLGLANATVVLTVVAPQASPPFITQQPAGQVVNEGQEVSFNITVTGVLPPTFQWLRDGVPIGGATSATLTLDGVSSIDKGTYTVIATNASGSATSEPAVLTVTTSYDAWKAVHFSAQEIAIGSGAPTADLNGDGILNLMEYALDRDPRTGVGGSLPSVGRSNDNHLQFTFQRDTSRTDLTYTVQSSNDLVTWTPIARSVLGAATQSVANASSVAENGGTLKAVVVKDLFDLNTPSARFLRLEITLP
jgi:PKD repeat protein